MCVLKLNKNIFFYSHSQKFSIMVKMFIKILIEILFPFFLFFLCVATKFVYLILYSITIHSNKFIARKSRKSSSLGKGFFCKGKSVKGFYCQIKISKSFSYYFWFGENVKYNHYNYQQFVYDFTIIEFVNFSCNVDWLQLCGERRSVCWFGKYVNDKRSLLWRCENLIKKHNFRLRIIWRCLEMYKSCWILMNFCPPLIWPFKLEIMIQNGEENREEKKVKKMIMKNII